MESVRGIMRVQLLLKALVKFKSFPGDGSKTLNSNGQWFGLGKVVSLIEREMGTISSLEAHNLDRNSSIFIMRFCYRVYFWKVSCLCCFIAQLRDFFSYSC